MICIYQEKIHRIQAALALEELELLCQGFSTDTEMKSVRQFQLGANFSSHLIIIIIKKGFSSAFGTQRSPCLAAVKWLFIV